jgi:hypothetical protein
MPCKPRHYSMQSSRLTLERSPLSAKGWLQSETVAGWKTDQVPKAWRLLEHTLDRHDSASIGWKYRKVRSRINGVRVPRLTNLPLRQVCLERIMESDRNVAPPTWLTTFFQDREPEYLIRTCLRYHLIMTALDYTMFMIQKVSRVRQNRQPASDTHRHCRRTSRLIRVQLWL